MGAASWLINLGFGGSDPGAPATDPARTIIPRYYRQLMQPGNEVCGMQKNVAGQKWVVFAFGGNGHANEGVPITGDALNITANLRLDGGAANAVDDVNPTELEDGYYIFDISQAESNGENIVICPESATANVEVIGVPGAVYTTPANMPDLSITATTGRVDVAAIGGTTQTANDVGGDVDAILVDTADMQPKLGTPAGADMSADIAAIQADTDNIQTRIPAALVGGRMDSDMSAISTSTAAADNLEASAEVIITAAATTGTLSITQMTTNLTEATDDHYNGRIIIWTSGVLLGQATDITDYTGATKLLTFTSVTEAPSNGDTFVIV